MTVRHPGDGYTYTGPVMVDARIGLAAARGELSHAAYRVYVAICHHRHGHTARIADRELSAWAGVDRHAIPRLLAELHRAFPDALAVISRHPGNNGMSTYLVPLPLSAARRRSSNGAADAPTGQGPSNGAADAPKPPPNGASRYPQRGGTSTNRERGGNPPYPPPSGGVPDPGSGGTPPPPSPGAADGQGLRPAPSPPGREPDPGQTAAANEPGGPVPVGEALGPVADRIARWRARSVLRDRESTDAGSR